MYNVVAYVEYNGWVDIVRRGVWDYLNYELWLITYSSKYNSVFHLIRQLNSHKVLPGQTTRNYRLDREQTQYRLSPPATTTYYDFLAISV